LSAPFALKVSRTRENGETDPNAEAKDQAEADLERTMGRRLSKQERDVMDALGDPPDLAKLTREFWDTEAGAMLADLRPEIERMALDSVAAAGTTVPIVWDEAVIAREAADWAGRYTYELIRDLTGNTQRLVTDQVGRFVQTPGMTIGQLRQALTSAFGQSRAQAIAVTETTRAYAEGNKLVQAELRRAGLEMVQHWQTSGSDVCDLCRPLDGKPEDEWGSHGDGPPAHPRCRCWTTMRRRQAGDMAQMVQVPIRPEDFAEVTRIGDIRSFAGTQKDWAFDSVTDAEAKVLTDYKAFDYKRVNRSLRGGYEPPEMQIIDHTIGKAPPIPRDVKLYRGISADALPDLKAGDIWQDRAYISTSLDKKITSAFGGVQVEILAPKGSPGVFLDYFGSTEYEVLLPRGAQFRVLERTSRRLQVEYLMP